MRVVIMSCRPYFLGSAGRRFLWRPAFTLRFSTTTSARSETITTTVDSGHWQQRKTAEGARQLERLGFAHVSRAERSTLPETDDSRQDLGLEASFYRTIQDGQPDLVMNALLDPCCAELVVSMPQNIFVEVLQLLSPSYFVNPYREIHRPLHPTAVRVKRYKSLDSIFDDFAEKLAAIVQLRQSAGHVLGLAEYTHLLDCARSIGDAYMADMIWNNMRESGVSPDVQCYNHYMEAKAWDMAYTDREKYNLRMTPFAYRKRKFIHPNDGWRGYGTAGRSIRKEVLQIFNEMTEEGHHGDEATFVNVIMACSRVGHVKGIKNVLKTAWNIDVDALLTEPDESNLPPVKNYASSSPLHPTYRLLFTIAHVLGTNNDMPAAVRTLDFVARAYNLSIPEKVWLELFERCFVLSRPRFGRDVQRNAKGKVSYNFVNLLFQTMTAAPYHVNPTIEVHHILAKTAWDRDRLSEFQHHMRAAYDLLTTTRQKRKKARSIIEKHLSTLQSFTNKYQHQAMPNPALANAIHTYDLLRLRTAQQTLILERLARLLLINTRWTGRDNPAWERRLLPHAIEEWQDFLPESFVYHTRGGLVRFCGGTGWNQAYLNSHNWVPVRGQIGLDFEHGEEEEREIEDDFFWKEYRRAFPGLFEQPPLNRLFEGACGAALDLDSDSREDHEVSLQYSA